MPATNASCRGTSVMIAAAGLLLDLNQALLRLGLRNVAKVGERYVSRRRRQRSKCLNWHKVKSVPNQVSHLESGAIIPVPVGSQLSVPQVMLSVVLFRRNGGGNIGKAPYWCNRFFKYF
jgi:hypothetical protein